MKPRSWRTGPLWLAAGLVLAIASLTPAHGQGAGQAAPQGGLPAILRDVGIDQHLDQRIPLDLHFRDESGQPVLLGSYFGGKPVILSFAYFTCPMLCTQVFNGLSGALRGMSLRLGDDFDVITVSIDPHDTPQQAAARHDSALHRYGRPDATGWHVLTGDAPAIAALTRAAGFRYAYDAGLRQFAHASGVLVLTPDGRISRYFLGIEYPPRDLRLALVEASAGRIGTPVDRLLLFCFHYDPATFRYGPAILRSIRAGGLLTLLLLLGFIGLCVFRERARG